MSPNIRLKRVYEGAEKNDGCRILVDRLWPRAVTRKRARIDYWARQAAPSDKLRNWYGHDPKKWGKFKNKYFRELDDNPIAVRELMDAICPETTTFVYGSKEREHNNAAALKEYVEKHLAGR